MKKIQENNQMKKISFIIPCKNEEKFISKCIYSILNLKNASNLSEIIVVDNGSNDETMNILEKFSNQLSINCLPNVSISELRNFGAIKATGEILAFIDADVELCEEWLINLIKLIFNGKTETNHLNDRNIYGSTYVNPRNPTWIQKVWYDQLEKRDESLNHYINGGNLVVFKKFFDEVGGFDKEFKTGEDVKFCMDAVKAGGKIVKNKKLVAMHHGYPRDLKSFFRREKWHALGIENYLLRPWKSKDLILGIYYLFLFVLALMVMVFFGGNLFIFGILIVLLYLPILPFSFTRNKGGLLGFFMLSGLYIVWGIAKMCALLEIFLKKTVFFLRT